MTLIIDTIQRNKEKWEKMIEIRKRLNEKHLKIMRREHEVLEMLDKTLRNFVSKRVITNINLYPIKATGDINFEVWEVSYAVSIYKNGLGYVNKNDYDRSNTVWTKKAKSVKTYKEILKHTSEILGYLKDEGKKKLIKTIERGLRNYAPLIKVDEKIVHLISIKPSVPRNFKEYYLSRKHRDAIKGYYYSSEEEERINFLKTRKIKVNHIFCKLDSTYNISYRLNGKEYDVVTLTPKRITDYMILEQNYNQILELYKLVEKELDEIYNNNKGLYRKIKRNLEPYLVSRVL